MQMDVDFMLSDTLDVSRTIGTIRVCSSCSRRVRCCAPRHPISKPLRVDQKRLWRLRRAESRTAGDDSGTEEGSDDERAPAEDDEEEEQEVSPRSTLAEQYTPRTFLYTHVRNRRTEPDLVQSAAHTR
jgi:hypothetical protein